MNWRHLRQEGFLTLAIVLAGAVIVEFFLPNFNLQEAEIAFALLALALGLK